MASSASSGDADDATTRSSTSRAMNRSGRTVAKIFETRDNSSGDTAVYTDNGVAAAPTDAANQIRVNVIYPDTGRMYIVLSLGIASSQLCSLYLWRFTLHSLREKTNG